MLSLAAVAQAVNPADDDAGSGRDAGDQPATAVPIQPGTHEGRVTEQIDRVDHYSFEAEQGDVVVATVPDGGPRLWVGLVGPDGEEHAYGADFSGAWVPIPETGTWTVKLELTGSSNQLPQTSVDYTFQLERSDDFYTHERTVEDGWYTAEIDVDQPGRLLGYVRGASPQEPSHAYANFGAVASSANEADGGSHGHWSAHGYGHGARQEASPISLVEELVPGEQAPTQRVDAFSPWNIPQIVTGYVDAQMRVTALEAPDGHGLKVAVASTTPFELREASGSEVTHWTSSDNEPTALGEVPGVMANGPASLKAPTEHGLRGYFYTYDRGGRITDPSGDCYATDSELFAHPEAGPWRFDLNPDQDAVYSEHVYLVAADVPRLGLFDSRGDPLGSLRDPGCP